MEQRSSRLATLTMHTSLRRIEHNSHHITRIIRRGNTSKRNPILTVRVALAGRIHLLSSTRLATNLIARHSSLRARTLLHARRIALSHRTEHVAHSTGRIFTHHTRAFRLWQTINSASRIGHALDNARRHALAIVSDRLIHTRHLQQSQRHTLTDRQICERTTRPLLAIRQQTSRFARQLHARQLANAKLLQHVSEAILPHPLRQHQGANIRRLTEHAGGRVRHNTVLPRIADRHTRHVNGTGNLQHLIRGSQIIFNGSRRRDDLRYRTRLERRGNRRIIEALATLQLTLNIPHRIHRVTVGHCQHLAGFRVKHHSRRLLCTRINLGLLHLLLHIGLEIQVDREFNLSTIDGRILIPQRARNSLIVGGNFLNLAAVNTG